VHDFVAFLDRFFDIFRQFCEAVVLLKSLAESTNGTGSRSDVKLRRATRFLQYYKVDSPALKSINW
jgi:hypothetical protein